MSPTQADRFANQYRALRAKEGWADSAGVENPDRGPRELWAARIESVREAAAIIAAEWPERRPLVADVGAGGGWAAEYLERTDVVSIDLIPIPNTHGAKRIRADMRFLPFAGRSMDGLLFIASLHCAPLDEVVAEASRVLRPTGLLVAMDSPIYPDARSSESAVARSAAYYGEAGFPDLAAHYHPLDAGRLRDAFDRHGLRIEQLRFSRGLADVWRRLQGLSRSMLLVARRSD